MMSSEHQTELRAWSEALSSSRPAGFGLGLQIRDANLGISIDWI
jgi:hypothetical protein